MRFDFMKTTVFILTGAFILTLGIILYLTWYPHNPITVNSITTDKQVVARGECITFFVDGEKHLPIPVDVTVEMVDGVSYFIMSYTSNNPTGKIHRGRSFTIPYHIKPGVYKIRWTGVYTINPLKIVRVKKLSTEYEVK
jgi:hypothetical protein